MDYPRADITVHTTADNFALTVPAPARQSKVWSAQFEDQLRSLKTEIDDLNAATQIECGHYQATSKAQKCPYAEAAIPLNLPNRNEYFATGGGCEVTGSITSPVIGDYGPGIS
jgi:hypothetical protein